MRRILTEVIPLFTLFKTDSREKVLKNGRIMDLLLVFMAILSMLVSVGLSRSCLSIVDCVVSVSDVMIELTLEVWKLVLEGGRGTVLGVLFFIVLSEG